MSGWGRPSWIGALLSPGHSLQKSRQYYSGRAFRICALATVASLIAIFPSQAAVIDTSTTAGSIVWGTGTNWDGSIAPANDLTTDIARFDKTSYLTQPTAGSRSVSGIQIGDGTTATATLTLTNTALSLGGNGITTMFANAGAATLTGGNVKVCASLSWANNTSNLLTINSAVTNNGNTTPFNLTLNGSGSGGTGRSEAFISDGAGTGTLNLSVNTTGGVTTLSGANSYTGGTTLTLGTLKFSGSGTLGGTSNTLTVNGAHPGSQWNHPNSRKPDRLGRHNPE